MKKLFLVLLFAFISTSAFAAFPVKYDEKLDVGSADKTFTLKNNTVTVSATRPMKPMKPFQLIYTFKNDNVEKISLNSNMEMNMGAYNNKAVKKDSNVFTVELVLTKCMSGKTKWFTKANIHYKDGSIEELIVFYDVK